MSQSNARPNQPVAPVAPTRLRPATAEIERGLLATWQRRNQEATIPHSIQMLQEWGHVANVERLVTGERVPFAGFVFADSDLHKTMEGIAWTPAEAERDSFFEHVLALYEKAQADDGYLNSAFQGWDARQIAWTDFAQGHELYCLGHLVQAGIAARRNGRGDRLLDVARRFADLAVSRFSGPDRPEIPGHQEIEMALVELYRETGERSYLDLATQLVDRRGHGWLGSSPYGPHYYQDAVPFREMSALHGHAVRATYLCAGAADVAIETRDQGLLDHLGRLWDDMVATRSYVTGGIGSRHRDEAFGDAYELPSERAYAETCAAVGLVQWAWRMLLATGEAKYADGIERVLFNAFAVGLSADGRSFFYSNPLQRRPDHVSSHEEGAGHRFPWYHVSCCPPNIIRTMATLHDYLATQDDTGLQVHLPAAAVIDGEVAGAAIRIRVEGDYPWESRFEIRVEETPAAEWTLRFRLPAGAKAPRLDGRPVRTDDGYLTVRREWRPGDAVRIEADLPAVQVFPHPKVDALRGSSAVLRGPLVYCAEQVDNSAQVDSLHLKSVEGAEAIAGDGEVSLQVPMRQAVDGDGPLYQSTRRRDASHAVMVRMIPYFRWGNRGSGAMRVWIPS